MSRKKRVEWTALSAEARRVLRMAMETIEDRQDKNFDLYVVTKSIVEGVYSLSVHHRSGTHRIKPLTLDALLALRLLSLRGGTTGGINKVWLHYAPTDLAYEIYRPARAASQV